MRPPFSLSLSLSLRARNCNGKGTPFPRRPCFLVYLNENEYDSVPLAPCAEALKEHCGGNLLPKIYLEYCRTFHINQRQEFNYLSVGRPNANKPYSIVKPQLAFDSALRQVHIDRSAPLGIDWRQILNLICHRPFPRFPSINFRIRKKFYGDCKIQRRWASRACSLRHAPRFSYDTNNRRILRKLALRNPVSYSLKPGFL